jgi:hypothetical protein
MQLRSFGQACIHHSKTKRQHVLSVEQGEMFWGLETKDQGALLIMVTVSAFSREDSALCPNLVSMLFFFQIHEVRRVTTLSLASCEVCHPVTHLSLL